MSEKYNDRRRRQKRRQEAYRAEIIGLRVAETVLRERVTAFAQWANGIALALDDERRTKEHTDDYLTHCRTLYRDAVAAEVAARIERGEG